MFFYSEPLIFIKQVLCFYKFANRLIQGKNGITDGTYLSNDLYKSQNGLLKIQNGQRTKENTDRTVLRKNK